jgi:hypothetical protein
MTNKNFMIFQRVVKVAIPNVLPADFNKKTRKNFGLKMRKIFKKF